MGDQQSIQPQDLQFLAQVAHQLKSPVAAVKMLLRMLSGEFAGPLTEQQKEILRRAAARCDEATESIARMLSIANLASGEGAADEVCDLAATVRRVVVQYANEALRNDVALASDLPGEPVWVRGSESALFEAAACLVDNAFKYTPPFGRVHVAVLSEPESDVVRLVVEDSGIGIPEEERERVFQPFYRTSVSQQSAQTGTGLGLAFVRAVVESCGGRVRVEDSDLGGARFVVEVKRAEPHRLEQARQQQKAPSLRVVIVGGVAAGPKAASKIIRLKPDAEVTVVERGMLLSYAGCGLPYYVSGVIRDQKELMSTPAGIVRDAVFFQRVKNVRAFNNAEAVEIDRENRRVKVRDLLTGQEVWLEYDRLLLATGARAAVPDVPGKDLKNIFTLHGVRDAEGLRAALASPRARDVVIVGGGLIGVEITEWLVKIGCRVTVVEMRPQILGMLDWEMAKLVERHMESHGVRVLTGTRVKALAGDERVTHVVTEGDDELPADIVILATGVRPNVELAQEAGLELGPTGAIRVDEHLRTSDPNIYAAGDCVETRHLLTGQPCYMPLGSVANKQGRVAAINICGGEAVFPGVLATTVCRVFDYCVARTGLSEAEARAAGFDCEYALVPGPDREHFVPDAGMLLLKIVADRKTRRVLGVQATGTGAADKRVDVAAVAITAGMTVEQLSTADLGYAPPYSPAFDNLITAANVVANKLDGHLVGIHPRQVYELLERREDFVFLDVRTPAEYERVRLPGARLIPLGALRGRLRELPRDKLVVVFSSLSLRAYEASLVLRAHGFRDVRVLDGGIEMWPFEKLS